jgi:hypothetical protein
MKRTTRELRRIDEATAAILDELQPGVDWSNPNRIQASVKGLARAAVLLYAEAWGSGYDVRQWEWPLRLLRGEIEITASEQFNPWTVLLLKACTIYGRSPGIRYEGEPRRTVRRS